MLLEFHEKSLNFTHTCWYEPCVFVTLGSDLFLETIQKHFLSLHLVFWDHINEFRRKSLFYQFYWDLSHWLVGNMTLHFTKNNICQIFFFFFFFVTSPASLCCGPWARHIYPSLVLVKPRKTHPYITERLLMGRKESNQTNKQTNKYFVY